MERDFSKLKVFDESSPPGTLRGTGAAKNRYPVSPKDTTPVCRREVFCLPDWPHGQSGIFFCLWH